MLDFLTVGFGGFIGASLRYLFTLVPIRSQYGFPVHTLAINVIGAFVMGLVTALALRNQSFDPRLALFLRTGLCGGFSTFSAFALETARLIEGGSYGIAATYMVSSVVLTVAAVFVAEALVR